MLSSPTQHFTALKNLFKGAVGAKESSLTNSFMQHYKNSYKYVVVYNLKFWWQRTATIPYQTQTSVCYVLLSRLPIFERQNDGTFWSWYQI